MSNKSTDSNIRPNSSRSRDLSNNNNNNQSNGHNELTQSRNSSASNKNEEQRSDSVNNPSDRQFSNERGVKSPVLDQPTNSSHSSLQVNEPNNDGPVTTNHQNQLDFTSNSLDLSIDDDEKQENSHRALTTNRTDLDQKSESNSPTLENHQSKNSPTKSFKTKDLDSRHPSCRFHSDKKWLDLQFHKKQTNTNTENNNDDEDRSIKKPNELESEMENPPGSIDPKTLDRVQGSIIGMALGDSLGAHVEFRPRQYLIENPVTDLEGGGTWGLEKGQFTDDTSMALCLAISLVACRDCNLYDQLVRYKWWYKHGYMSSTGLCFDIGAATSQSIHEFERRQKQFSKENDIPLDQMDYLSDPELLKQFNKYCSEDGVAGNGALMRLAPVPLFFFRYKAVAVECSGHSGEITHGDQKAYDACRFYAALITAALHGFTKKQILAKNFYSANKDWFNEEPLHDDIKTIAEGSYKKKVGYKRRANGTKDEKDIVTLAYEHKIRGKGYIVDALEAALWAFWSTDSFQEGALAAVNLGDDTDTTAAIFGQLAGAHYGYKQLPPQWLERVYAREFLKNLSKWIVYEGEQWHYDRTNSDIKK